MTFDGAEKKFYKIIKIANSWFFQKRKWSGLFKSIFRQSHLCRELVIISGLFINFKIVVALEYWFT